MPETSPQPPEKSVLTLIQQLKDGSIHARTLTREQRQQCVEALLLEGYSIPQIAQVVDRSEKTVTRDRDDIRRRNALSPSPELAKELIGDLLIRTEAHHARLMRISRSAEGSPSEKTQAEFLAFRVIKERTELLQSLGYLPQHPQQVQGEFVHHVDAEGEEQTIEVAEQMVSEVMEIARETGGLSPEVARQLPVLREKIDQAKLKQQAQRLLDQQKKAGDGRERSDGE